MRNNKGKLICDICGRPLLLKDWEGIGVRGHPFYDCHKSPSLCAEKVCDIIWGKEALRNKFMEKEIKEKQKKNL